MLARGKISVLGDKLIAKTFQEKVFAMFKVLIIEDDRNLADTISKLLITEDYAATICHDGDEGLSLALSQNFDVLLLDLQLPGLNGMEICRQLKSAGSKIPIIMVTAKSGVEHVIAGLDAGADDYLPKPFSSGELLARVKAVTRRTIPQAMSLGRMRYGDLEFVVDTNEIVCGSESFALSDKEAKLLFELFREPGMLCPKDALVRAIWPDDPDVDMNNVEAYVSFLRKKLKFLETNVSIITLRKRGYKLEIVK